MNMLDKGKLAVRDSIILATVIAFMQVIFIIAVLALLDKGAFAAEDIKLRIMWQNPTEFVDGRPLTPTEITGYDIYYRFNDGKLMYGAWHPYDSATDVRVRDIATTNGYGTYCITMVTVSAGNGKSPSSEPVCYEHEQTTTVPGYKPKPPTGIIVSPLGN